MKTMVKWADMKKVGVPRRLWRRAKTRMRPVAPAKNIYRADDVSRVLGLDPDLFERMK